MHRDIENVAFVGYQPSTEEADNWMLVRISITRRRPIVVGNRDHYAREGEGQLAFEGCERPRRREGEPLDLEDAGQVTSVGVPNLDRHLSSTSTCRRRRQLRGIGQAARCNWPASPLITITSSILSRIRCLNAVTGLPNSIRVVKSAGNDDDTYDSRRIVSPRTLALIERTASPRTML